MFMQVILLEKVTGLGKADEVVEAAEGYARNFLFPRHLAVLASPKATQDLAAKRNKEAREEERDLHEQEQLVEKIDGLELELKEKVSEQGVLYAAVTPVKVVKELGRLGYSVEEKQMVMKPIKEPGSYPIKIKFRHGLEAEVRAIISVL